MLKTKKAHKKFFRGSMRPGYWDLYPFGCAEEFDVHRFVCDAESGKLGFDRDQTWYKVLKYDTEHGVYDKTVWNRLYYGRVVAAGCLRRFVCHISHGNLFPVYSHDLVGRGGNEFIWMALVYGHAYYPRDIHLSIGSLVECKPLIDEIYGGLV